MECDCVTLLLQPKCQQYWPDGVNKSCTYGNISVTLIQEEILAEYTIRTLAVKMVNSTLKVMLVQYLICFLD